MDSYKLIVVDDEVKFVEVLAERLKRKGVNVKAFTSSLDALDTLKEEEFDAALFDIMMDNLNGLQLLEKCKDIQPNLEVVMLTGNGTVETAIEAMKKGAYDYLIKPVNPNKLEMVLQRAAERKWLKDQNLNLSENIKRINKFSDIIGESKVMEELKYVISRVGDSTLPALILGESGTGKDLVANALHYYSKRRDQPFIPINSGAIPGELLESELFGHVKGAFTGAHVDKKGLVELANGGTLFLDEIGDMDPMLQVKLLRFLDTGEYRPVGGTIARKTNVRIVTATNKDLEESIRQGNFREDLYYRLGVVTIHVPPLRDREDDILLLAEHFLRENVGNKKHLSQNTKSFLLTYDFPGNVRELANFIERGVLLSNNEIIEPNDMFANIITSKSINNTILSLQEVEKEHINHVLKICSWNKPKAANMLKIGLRTLYRKIEEYNLTEN